jgi:hypothetical protein
MYKERSFDGLFLSFERKFWVVSVTHPAGKY